MRFTRESIGGRILILRARRFWRGIRATEEVSEQSDGVCDAEGSFIVTIRDALALNRNSEEEEAERISNDILIFNTSALR